MNTFDKNTTDSRDNEQLTDDPTTVPDYDYFVDESLCDSINQVNNANSISRSLLVQVLGYVNNSQSNHLVCFECFRKLEVGMDFN